MNIFYNNEFYPSDQPVLRAANRSFLYGDGVFESMRMINGKVFLLDKHFERITKASSALKIEFPDYIDLKFLEKNISELAVKNETGGNARIRINIFRSEGGLYTPDNNAAEILISAVPAPDNFYRFNVSGLYIDVFEDLLKSINKFSQYKSSNALLFVMAGLWTRQHNLDECIILNTKRNICECLSSNIFMVKDGNIITPAAHEGCIDGVMRNHIITLLETKNYHVEETEIKLPDLVAADEVFITNASSGVRWVSAYRKKRYFSKYSKIFSDLLNSNIN